MSSGTSTITWGSSDATWSSRAADWLELAKPRISVLVLVTVAVAHFVARWGQPHPWVLVATLLGTLLVAASASALNQWIERGRDALMERTSGRPLASGRMRAPHAVGFAAVTGVSGIAVLWRFVAFDTVLWAVATWAAYVLVYTPLKCRTAWNTAVGAVAGALPLMIGWSAAGNAVPVLSDARAVSLFLLVFLWQFPHFMAIAWIYRGQYADAGMKMLTVVDPTGRAAGVHAVLAALALLPVSFVPAVFAPGWGSAAFLVAAFLLGAAQLAFALRFLVGRSEQSARWLLRASLVYLPAIMLFLVALPLT